MSDRNTLYLECYSGISGDMAVAALLDLGATEENLRMTLEKLPLDGYEIRIGRVKKSGLDACDFDVILKHREHEHRTWRDIEQMLKSAGLKPEVLKLAGKMFGTVARAEGKVHNRPTEEVHFHEVGAVDSIVDIVSVAACLEELGVDKILVSEIWEGQGHVQCQHGILPVPVPAVLQIAADEKLRLRQTEQQGEMVTPTGAAIAALGEQRIPEHFVVKKAGLGAGKKDFPRTNVLRAMLIEEIPTEDLWMLESNIDDCSGEVLGYTMECLLEAGARDVFFTPIYMKKNRPAYKLSLLCDEGQIRDMDAILFRETTTIGIRRYRVQREILKRRMEEVQTAYGSAAVKVCTFDGEELRYPEYESVKDVAKAGDLSYQEAYDLIRTCLP